TGRDQVVFVNAEGPLVRAPGTTATTTTTTTTVQQPTTTTTVQEPVQTVQPAEGTVVTYDQVQQNLPPNRPKGDREARGQVNRSADLGERQREKSIGPYIAARASLQFINPMLHI